MTPKADSTPDALRTIPGKSLDAQFDALWQRFTHLSQTVDTLNRWPMRWRRWLTPINISFIVPINDAEVTDYLIDAQQKLAPYMGYTPQPIDKLHVTLYQIGYLRAGLPISGTWLREELNRLAQSAAHLFEQLPPFTVRIGPLNAFPNVAIAEVHDNGQLRLLESAAANVIPASRRLSSTYPLIPHITLGYFGSRPALPVVKVLRPLRTSPGLPLRIDRAAITLYYRESGAYQAKHMLRHSVEEVIATLPLSKGDANAP